MGMVLYSYGETEKIIQAGSVVIFREIYTLKMKKQNNYSK